MIHPILRAAPFAAAIMLTACAAPGAKGAGDQTASAAGQRRECFTARDVTSFNAVDDRTVNLRVGVREMYQLELFSTCPDVDWATGIAIQARGGSWICSGMDAVVIAPGPFGPQRCLVRSVRKLTAAEVKAMSEKDKP